MNKKIIGIIFIVLILVAVLICLLIPKEELKVGARVAFVFNPVENVQIPDYNTDAQVVEHKAYSLQYNEKHEQADWVAYMLTKDQLENTVKRKDKFKKDPLVTTGSAEPKDYTSSGYDKGHLAPAADMSWTEEVMLESFFMSNMSPQKPGFNRGIWKKLEEQVRDWATQYDTIYVVTGPVLEDGLNTIGVNEVSIPKKYYKALLVYKSNLQTAVAFILNNDSSSTELKNFAITVDSLERVTSIDFFSKLPDGFENKIESTLKISDWFNEN